jgi:hypothetical protein
MPHTGTVKAMAKESTSDTVKITFYIEKPVAKEFKKRAIDEEVDYSQLANRVLLEYLEKNPSPEPSR